MRIKIAKLRARAAQGGDSTEIAYANAYERECWYDTVNANLSQGTRETKRGKHKIFGVQEKRRRSMTNDMAHMEHRSIGDMAKRGIEHTLHTVRMVSECVDDPPCCIREGRRSQK